MSPPDQPTTLADRALLSRNGIWYATWFVLLAPLVVWVAWPDDFVALRLFEPAQPEVVDLGPAPPPAPIIFETGNPAGGEAVLRVESVPSGANVALGGVSIGQTPVHRTDLRSGTWELEIAEEGYVTRTLAVTLSTEHAADANEVLRPAVGLIRVQTDPSGSWIKWAGRRMTARTPVQFKNIPVGNHVFEVGQDGFHTERFEVEVRLGRVTPIVAHLRAR